MDTRLLDLHQHALADLSAEGERSRSDAGDRMTTPTGARMNQEIAGTLTTRLAHIHAVRRSRLSRFVRAIVAGLVSACGSASDGVGDRVVTETLTGGEIVVTTASEMIGGVADLSIGSDGRIHVLDYQFKHVLSLTSDGTDPRRIGREGSGPGEFKGPAALSVGAERLWVYDRENSRVDTFDRDGAVLRTHSIGTGAVGGSAALNGRGELALTTGGLDSTMVAVFDNTGGLRASFGEPIVPPVSFFDFTAMKETIRAGAVPDQFRNSAKPVWGEDGSVWLIFQTEAEIRRYTPDGATLWSHTISDPLLESIRQDFFRRNIEEQRPFVISPLSYFTDAQDVGGELWLLLNSRETDEGSVFLVLDGADGAIKRRVVVPEVARAGPFSIDRQRGQLFIVNSTVASILRLPWS